MKSMKSLLVSLLFAFLLIMTSCSGPNKKELESKIKTLEDSIKSLHELINNSNTEMGIPITSNEYGYLMGNRYFAYSISKNGSVVGLPKFIDPILKVEDLIQYAKSGDTAIYKGIRMYPGLTRNDELLMIACLGKDTVVKDEKEYRVFDKADFTVPENPFPTTELPSPNDAKTLNTSYTNQIYIYNLPQAENNLRYRKSRFYFWSEIKNLLDSNIIGFNWNDSKTYTGYKIKLEIGYTPDSIAEQFHKLWPAWDKINHIGFTCIFHVIDKEGHDVIDPRAIRNPANLNNYKNLYLEVGNPCPPRCGVLHE